MRLVRRATQRRVRRRGGEEVQDLTHTPLLTPSFADFESEIMASYVDQCTDVMGVTTGWKGLDELYRVSDGGVVDQRACDAGAHLAFDACEACINVLTC